MSRRAAGQDAGLDAGAERDDLVGIEVDERRPAEELLPCAGAPAARASSRRPRPPPRRRPASRPASLSACRHGPAVRSTRSRTSASNSSRVIARRTSTPVRQWRARPRVRGASDSARFARSAIASTWARTCGCVAQRRGQLRQQQIARAARRGRRRRGACRRWSPAPRRRRRAASGSRRRRCRRRGRRPRSMPSALLVRGRRPARPRSARSRAAAPRGRRAGRRPCVAWRWLSLK